MAAAGQCFAAAPFNIELYADSQKTGGVRLVMPVTEFRIANRPDKLNYGLGFSTASIFKKLPVEIKFGNLSFAGSLSKLNFPELSNGTSPFSSSVLSTGCLTASLPGYSSFSKPESSFFQMKVDHLTKAPLTFTMNAAVQPDYSYPVFSTMLTDKLFSNKLTLSASCTAGKFPYKENTSSSWFLKSPYYAADQHFCSLFQFSAAYNNRPQKLSFQTAFMSAIYESPFGPYTAAYRADLKLGIDKTEIYASAFLNAYEDILTSSDKKLEPSSQFKAGFITKKPFLTANKNIYFIKIGSSAFSRINLTENQHPLRINSGIQLSTDKTAISFSISADSKMKSSSPEELPQSLEKDSLSLQIKNTWNFKMVNTGITINIEENKYKLSLNLSNNSQALPHKFSGNCALTLNTKDGKIKDRKFSTGITCRLNFRMLTIIGKLSASLE